MSRKRLTQQFDRRASAHPAYPDEGITHPAGRPDPEADAYENGDTSSWAEDVHPGPYRTSPAPAVPMDDGSYRHPAAQPGAPARNASMTRAAAEIRAKRCLKLASAMLGKYATDDMIEDQALTFMHLADEQIVDSLRRLQATTLPEEVLLRKMFAGDDSVDEEIEEEEDEDEDEDEDHAKEARLRGRRAADEDEDEDEDHAKEARLRSASDDEDEDDDAEGDHAKEASSDRIADLLVAMQKQIAALESRLAGPQAATACADDDAMLAEMLDHEAVKAEDVDDAMEASLFDDSGDLGVDMGLVDDPLADIDPYAPTDDDLFGGLSGDFSMFASENTSTGKTAAQRIAENADRKKAASSQPKPQPKKPSTGVRSVGEVRTAGASNEIDELSKLWQGAPDISDVFPSNK